MDMYELILGHHEAQGYCTQMAPDGITYRKPSVGEVQSCATDRLEPKQLSRFSDNPEIVELNVTVGSWRQLGPRRTLSKVHPNLETWEAVRCEAGEPHSKEMGGMSRAALSTKGTTTSTTYIIVSFKVATFY